MKKVLYLIMCAVFFSACSNSKINNTEEINRFEILESKGKPPVSIPAERQYYKSIQISIDTSLMIDNLKNICSHPRKFSTEGEKTALNYIKGKLEEYGYISSIQEFPVYKQDFKSTHVKYNNDYFKENPYNSEKLGTGKNIIAIRDGHSYNRKTIYLTAHYDTTANTNGVIDNGTGLSAVLELARLLKNYSSPFNIVFVLFSGEEYFRTGSKAFISSLSDKEKENTIGCINVDMVGEKDAGGLIIRANAGEHNILTLMINEQLKNPLSILEGGYSDELSFYLGKMPAITLTNKRPDPRRAKEKTQFQYIDTDELRNTVYLIIEFLVNFDTGIYNKLINERSFKSNRSMDNIDLADTFKPRKANVIYGFNLISINCTLLENGYDSETEYIYENKNGKKYTITERFKVFVNPNVYNSYKVLESDFENGASFGCLYFINADSNSDTKIFYLIGNYYGEIKGDMSADEAINILKACYKEEYKYIFSQ